MWAWEKNSMTGSNWSGIFMMKPVCADMTLPRNASRNRFPAPASYTNRTSTDHLPQPAVMVTGYACYRIFEEMCTESGFADCPISRRSQSREYTALLVAGAMDFRTCADLVNKEHLHHEFSESYPHAALMAIVNKGGELEQGRIESLTKEAKSTSRSTTPRTSCRGRLKKTWRSFPKPSKGNLFPPSEGGRAFHTPLIDLPQISSKRLAASPIYIADKPVIAKCP